jgi:hypothetical protein
LAAEHSQLNGPGANILAISDHTKELARARSLGFHLAIDTDRQLAEGDNPSDKKLIRKMAKKKTRYWTQKSRKTNSHPTKQLLCPESSLVFTNSSH